MVLFEEEPDENSEEEEERREREARGAAEEVEREAVQELCDLCGQPLLEPVRLATCRCCVCVCCVERSVRYTRQCPVCGETVALRPGKGGVLSDVSESLLRHLESLPLTAALEAQREYLTQLAIARTRANRLVLEFGNTSKASGNKVVFTTFCKVPSVEGVLAKKDMLARVDFNINPGYAKPTASVTRANDDKLGFSFEYSMARPFPCEMTVHLAGDAGLQLRICYVVQAVDRISRRVVVQFLKPKGSAKPSQVTFIDWDTELCNGWVRKCGRQAEVEYMPEATHKAAVRAHYAHPIELPPAVTESPGGASSGALGEPVSRAGSRPGSRPRGAGSRAGSSRSRKGSGTPSKKK